ncbi:MAG TPA: hypothetical protein VD862_03365 [Candidatus Paceibacterota bacterium]|nr:hypothetical protein [Candidatus Paceibacterota bacterium]
MSDSPDAGEGRMSIGIKGVGMVGTPLMRWFQEVRGHERGRDLYLYDTDPKLGYFDDVGKARVVFICVPTPPNPDGSCNTGIVESAVRDVPPGRIVIIKSTVPPGTTQRIQNARPDLFLMFNPEFLTESQAWADFIKPSRQIIGVTEQSARYSIDVLNLLPLGLYRRPDLPVYGGRKVVTATEAEMVKYASNVFGSMKVSFANVLADLCDTHGKVTGETVDYEHVRDMLEADLRIGPAWLDVNHGAYHGFGGYCFPKDTAAFIRYATDLMRQMGIQTSEPVTEELGGRIATINAAIDFLESNYRYNETLLDEQNLTIPEVSVHNRELLLRKRKPVRNR